MPSTTTKHASPLLVIIAFATVYIVCGSTYFFIRFAEGGGMPPFLLGAIRFTLAGLLLMGWCAIKGEKIVEWKNIANSAIVGIMLLFVGNGIVIWAEKTLPSAMVAIMVSSAPIWIVALDWPKWTVNFKSKATISGLIIGFVGVFILFSEQIGALFTHARTRSLLPWMLLLTFGSIAWSGGSLYARYKPTTGSAMVNTAWQMLVAGLVYIPVAALHHEFDGFSFQNISNRSLIGISYLVVFGSLAAYSAYVWLIQVRPATQVSTYAYVNPVIAVILGVVFAGEKISWVQLTGLFVILASLLLINLAKYRKEKQKEELVEA